MYAGYYPMGLSLRRIFEELPNVPFKDEVWPKFLRENAVRVLKLEAGPPRSSATSSASASSDCPPSRGSTRTSHGPPLRTGGRDVQIRSSHEHGAQLHDHLGGHPRRRQPRAVPGVPRPAVARRVRRVARPVQEPVEGPAQHRPAGAQLGRRPPRCRRAGRRRGRRGAVPQHRAAVLPGVRALRRAAQAGGLRAAPGRRPRPQPVAGRLLRAAAPSVAPASVRSSSTTSTTRSPTPRGSRSTACAAACCSRRCRRT